MSRMVMYLARTLEPPPVSSTVTVYGISDSPLSATVADFDEFGVTVVLGTSAHGTRTWHVAFPWVE